MTGSVALCMQVDVDAVVLQQAFSGWKVGLYGGGQLPAHLGVPRGPVGEVRPGQYLQYITGIDLCHGMRT